MSPCGCLGHPAAACRCQCGCPSAGCLPLACPHGVPGRHEGWRQVVVGPRGCRLPPWPESVSGCLGRGGQCPGSRPGAAGAVWPVDVGRPAFTYGPCRGAVRPVPWRVGGLVVAGMVFFPSGKGEFLFSAQFSTAIICILSSLCVIFAIDNQHPGNHGPGPLGARLRYPRKNNAGSLGRPARPAPARRGITEKLKL